MLAMPKTTGRYLGNVLNFAGDAKMFEKFARLLARLICLSWSTDPGAGH
jgi:hypothetical protein